MTLNQLKKGAVLLMHFKKDGYFDRSKETFFHFRQGNPSWCSIYCVSGRYYYAQRINRIDIIECMDYWHARCLFNDFVSIE